GCNASSKTYKDFKAIIREKGIPLQRLKMGDVIKGIDLDIEVLNPPNNTFSSPNNNSLVLKIKNKNLSFLLTGDIEEGAISFLSSTYSKELRTAVLKAPHQGRKKIPKSFLSLVDPKVIVANTNLNGAITIKGLKKGFKVIYTQ
ncbi:MAG: hypothetical protein AB1595_04430, partial [bacterium]